MVKVLRSKRGMALILVLGAVAIMTAMAVEFAYNTNVAYHLAQNELDRFRAQYLAQSAYRFMQVELKFDRMFRQVVQSQNLGQFLGANANLPLCQQFPISTGLIRAVFLGGEGAAELPPELKKVVTINQAEEAQEFLNFDGDFDGECLDESTKINLNFFYGLDPFQKGAEGQQNAYDRYKIDLTKFLSVEAYREVFEDADVKPSDAVRNIADWVDSNEVINELEGVQAGPEMSLYDRMGGGYPVKNGKLSTPDEVYLVDGVVDEWYAPLAKYFTVYGDGQTVNVCAADDIIVQIIIRRYVESDPSLPPVKLDDAETMAKLVNAVKDGCAMGGQGNQQKQQISQSLATAIGAAAAGGEAAEGGSPAGTGGTAATGFASYLSVEPRYFGLVLTGVIGDTTVRIKSVLDVKEADPKKWKLLYWRIY